MISGFAEIESIKVVQVEEEEVEMVEEDDELLFLGLPEALVAIILAMILPNLYRRIGFCEELATEVNETILMYRLTCKQFRVQIDNAIKESCPKLRQLLFLGRINIMFSHDECTEDRNRGDDHFNEMSKIVKTRWENVEIHVYPLGVFLSPDDEVFCRDLDPTFRSVASILTIPEEFKFDKILICSVFAKYWIPVLIMELEKQLVLNPNLTISFNQIDICCCWNDQTSEHSCFEISEDLIVSLFKLVRKLSGDKCFFGKNLCCYKCFNVTIQDENRYHEFLSYIDGNFVENPDCTVCQETICHNFLCEDCINPCSCHYNNEDYDSWINFSCKCFICGDCLAATGLDKHHWFSPSCQRQNAEFVDDDDDDVVI